jgi:hypothetical protein
MWASLSAAVQISAQLLPDVWPLTDYSSYLFQPAQPWEEASTQLILSLPGNRKLAGPWHIFPYPCLFMSHTKSTGRSAQAKGTSFISSWEEKG